jgi:hypothetical protein
VWDSATPGGRSGQLPEPADFWDEEPSLLPEADEAELPDPSDRVPDWDPGWDPDWDPVWEPDCEPE